MNSCKVVTVCSSDTSRHNLSKNAFIPDRRSFTKWERRSIVQGTSRIQSASLSSVLRPASHSEIANTFPTLLRQNHSTMAQRACSVDSDVLRKEINSAVLLLESRNERDMLPRNNTDHPHLEKLSSNFHYKVHDRNRMSQSAQRIIEQRIQHDIPRWKSAKPSGERSIETNTRKFHLRMLPADSIERMKGCNDSGMAPAKDRRHYHRAKDCEPKLILSSSNSLTNFITIDDISGMKNSWIQSKEKVQIPEKIIDVQTTRNFSIDIEQTEASKSREDVLRQYMDVYIHWRTVNAIEEHQRLVSGKSKDCKSAKIRSATPKQRLEQFKKIIDGQQSSAQKNFNSSTNVISSDASYKDTMAESEHNSIALTITTKINDFDKERDEYAFNEDLNIVDESASHEQEGETSSDTYSEIDWLECEDIQ